HCQLIVGEIDVLAGVEAGAAVLAHPPEGHGAEDGDGGVGGGAGGEGLENVGPHYWVAVEDGGAVGETLIDVLFGGGLEGRKLGFPGAIHVVGGNAAVEGGFVDLCAEAPEVGQGGVAGLGLGGGQGNGFGVVAG